MTSEPIELRRGPSAARTGTVVRPHGAVLVDLMAGADERTELLAGLSDLPSLTLSPRQECDLELLLNGGFSPLTGFMTRNAYEGVRDRMRLPNGVLWPMPVTLDTDARVADRAAARGKLALRDRDGFALALLEVEDAWTPDRALEAERVLGTTDRLHPHAAQLLDRTGPHYLGGRLRGIAAPRHYDFTSMRHSPASLRRTFAERGWDKVVAFQTRNPLHRSHVEIIRRAMAQTGAKLLLHPVVGTTQPGDIDPFTRVRCYVEALRHLGGEDTILSLLPLAMRMAGPREALWHALIRENFGCSHFIVGRDHAAPGNGADGRPFYGPIEAQTLARAFADEIETAIVPFERMVFVAERNEYLTIDEVPDGATALDISGTELRRRLADGSDVPEWFSYPEVVDELRRAFPRRADQGVVVLFTGLSGSGKTTVARALEDALKERGRRVTMLDGDEVRGHLSHGLGFSREDRNRNVERVAFVAREVARHGGVALCPLIAPYAEARANARRLVGAAGGFVEVHVATPLGVCETRDPKGLYAKARKGEIKGFTGIDDPYEPPASPDILLDTSVSSVDEAIAIILRSLAALGYVAEDETESGVVPLSRERRSRERRRR